MVTYYKSSLVPQVQGFLLLVDVCVGGGYVCAILVTTQETFAFIHFHGFLISLEVNDLAKLAGQQCSMNWIVSLPQC